jgi:hypothetical protein
MELIKLSDIDDKLELWRGTKIRLVNNGIDMHPDDKYFDYLLVTTPWDKDFMTLVNITEGSHKLGAAYATKVPVDKTANKIIVTKAGLRQTLGQDFKHCFLIKA